MVSLTEDGRITNPRDQRGRISAILSNNRDIPSKEPLKEPGAYTPPPADPFDEAREQHRLTTDEASDGTWQPPLTQGL